MAQLRDGLGNLIGVAGNPLIMGEDENEVFYGTYQAELVATVSATAQTANTGGFFWAVNPATSGKIIKLERIGFQICPTTAVAAGFPTAPRVGFTRFTFSGTPTGAVVAALGNASTQGKFDSIYPAPSLDWRSAITGLTCVYGHTLFSTLAPATSVVGTVTASQIQGVASDNEYQPRETEYEHVIRPGEGIVLFQPEAGSTGDTRKITARLFWEEIAA
jgi:hypothetical protein